MFQHILRTKGKFAFVQPICLTDDLLLGNVNKSWESDLDREWKGMKYNILGDWLKGYLELDKAYICN